ncbi:MGMT family protein [Cohnella phaseoli]|uniref:Methylated-DNA-protein-cysteine methyltransferase-like protein n=1 Tax=Cohnella phaseoli TaxID=456490 RepID=A0A3D9HTC7_9BACL|nr:MGMT family protein [Cohnella phaseoli]RED52727.1 methylated-DNA-protein-cysteine methyltransferase-like protein [Cohnella phaseoli]
MQPFTKRVVDIIRSIPEGRVMTYGQVAECAGSRRAARQVVRILHSLSEKHGLPWHRVLNSKGEIAIQEGEGRYMQQLYLENEGVEIGLNGLIDLEQYRHVPEADEKAGEWE